MANAAVPVPNIPGPTTVNYGDAYSQATGVIAPKVDSAISSLDPLPGQIRSDASNIASTYKSEIPFEQNIYSDLAKNLAITYGQQQTSLESQQKQEVGQQKAAAAKGGLDSTQGYQAAMVENINTKYNQQIQSLADQYGVQSDQLGQEASKSITDLIAEAQSAIMQGDTSAAQITSQIVGYKIQEQQMITDAANNIMSANTTAEKAYWAQTYQSAILDVRQQSLYLQAQKAGYSVPTSDFGGGAPAPKKGAGGKGSIGKTQSKVLANGYVADFDPANNTYYAPGSNKVIDPNNPPNPGGGGGGSVPGGSGTSGNSVLNSIGNDIGSAWSWIQQNL